MVELLVTYLEIRLPPQGRVLCAPTSAASIKREALRRQDYIALYRAVGTPLQWDQRLRMLPDELDAFLQNPKTHLYVLRLEGQPVGLCEFDGVGNLDIEITNFGLIADAQGRGLGPFLLDFTLRSVWSYAPQRVWLHTDTNDHPKALEVYKRAGFQIFSQRVETFLD